MVAARCHRDLPPEDHSRVPHEAWIVDTRSELFEPDNCTDAELNVPLAVSVIVAVGGVGYAVAVPQ